MDKTQVKQIIYRLSLPEGQYAVFGGSILAMLGIRPANDIDLFVTEALFNRLKEDGWQSLSEQNRQPYLVTTIENTAVQAFKVWEGGAWSPDIDEYINNPQVIEGLAFMPLDELYKWKVATRRPKDLVDIKLINKFVESV